MTLQAIGALNCNIPKLALIRTDYLRSIAFLFLSFLFLLNGCGPDGKLALGPGFGNAKAQEKGLEQFHGDRQIKDRSSAVQKYFTDRKLSLIEGIWVSTIDEYEIAITKNTLGVHQEFDYVGLVTDTKQSGWQRGQIKLLLKETAETNILTGTYITRWNSEEGVLLLLKSPNHAELTIPSNPYRLPDKTVLIRVFPKNLATASSDKFVAEGTAFFISSDLLATNYHIVKDAKTISIFRDGIPVNVDLAMKDPTNDIAILKVPKITDLNETVPTCLLLGTSESVRSGDAAFVLGFPLSGLLASSISVGQGIINNTAGIKGDPRFFQVSVPIQPGNSGSPLFDAHGNVIGIVTSMLNNEVLFEALGVVPQNVNFAVKVSYLRSMIALLPNGECMAPKSLTSQLNARDLQERSNKSVVPVKAMR